MKQEVGLLQKILDNKWMLPFIAVVMGLFMIWTLWTSTTTGTPAPAPTP